jgi:hypothetical protein
VYKGWWRCCNGHFRFYFTFDGEIVLYYFLKAVFIQSDIVFASKYRRKVYGEKRREIGEILRELCNWKKIKIVEAEVCPERIHILVEIPPKVTISSFVGILKGKAVCFYMRNFQN